MTHSDFLLGREFLCGDKRWRCTDIGIRSIVAVCLSDHPDDETWYHGPPYAVAETVFDEHDMEGCTPTGDENVPTHRKPVGSTWHYQAYRDADGVVQIYEDYFDESGDWQARTVNPIAPMGESLDELVGDLSQMLRDALIRPVKELDDGADA